jgi:lysophospholipase L1-like esterase
VRSRQILFRILVPLLSIAAILGILEIGLRLYGYDPLGKVLDGRMYFLRSSKRPGLDYDLAPGVVGKNWGTTIAINSHGFRDREYDLVKPPSVRRIVVLGDSIAFGTNLDVADTFPERLEVTYGVSGRPVEVLNLAVAGYDTLNEVVFLEQTGLAFSPDVVVVGYCINDLGSHSVNLALIRVLEKYDVLTRHSRLFQWLTSRADAAQQLLGQEFQVGESEEEFARTNREWIVPVRDDATLRRIVGGMVERLEAERPRISHPFLPWYLSENRIGKLRFAFERLARDARDGRFRVVVLLIPFLDDEGRPDLYRAAYDVVRHEARRAGFDTIDPTEELRAAGFERLMLRREGSVDVVHPNAEGHAMLAKALHEGLGPLGRDAP